MKHFTVAAIAASALLLGGCMANSVKSSGENVVIVQSLPSQFQCTFKGEVAGSQGNWLTGGWTSNQNLAIGARNDLRNEAGKLGANVVVIVETLNNTNEDNELENITHIGRAYLCR
ncbi:MAG TPA: DUF4156 domain-containing protein [Candidatus Aphodousia gallistercoris]|nr:DUF4156 domain-containing protein [Candidatus Aphodousia gallistercoris]